MVTLTLLEPQKKTAIRRWCFEDESIIRIGRSVDNHIVLTDSLVSRHHLEIKKITSNQDIAWEITNRGINGTFVNGLSIKKTYLPDTALIQLAQGGPILRFQVQGSGQESLSASVAKVPGNSTCKHEGNSENNLFCIKCGQPLKVQQIIRNYKVLRTLGQGGMGTTYLAWDADESIQKPKLLVLKQMNADMAKIAKAQELFEREAYTLRNLNHSGIPKYYDYFVEAQKKYLAMELIHGQDLEKLILQKGPVNPAQAITWMIQTCDVLDYLHSHSPPLIHRDIKPANLMVGNSDNRVVVLDFGAVKEIGTVPGTRIGAEGYCAPEQERGQPLIQSDLYAIGPTLIFLTTGENPFKFYRQRGRSLKFDVSGIPTITPELREIIDRVTEPLPRDRIQSAKELISALEGCK
ncbi:MAG: protein kinase [Mastigocoleus sp.]